MPRPSQFARTRAKVLEIVAAIPEGHVTTYGAIARHLGVTARLIARVLASFTDEESRTLPWYRVVAANGVVSTIKLGAVGRRQIAWLQAEGVSVTPRNKVEEFDAVFWQPS